jgi:hypothetical protein
LTALGLVPTDQTDASAVFARTTRGLVESGSVHQSYATSFGATVWIDEFSVAENEPATATIFCDAYSETGAVSDSPWTPNAAAALPALSANALFHGIGPVAINGTAIPQVTGIRYRSGLTVTANRVQGLPWPTGGVISGLQQEVEIDVSNIHAALGVIGQGGLRLNGTSGLNVTLLASYNGVLTATGQLVLVGANGFASVESNEGDHGDIATGTIIVRLANSAGSASGLVVS